MEHVLLRPATTADLPAVADLHHRVREAAYPRMPRSLHPLSEVRAWVGSWDLAEQEVWVAAAGPEDGGALLGYARVRGDWLDDLYVAPEAAGQGIGGTLLDLVKTLRPGGFCLWVFESNDPARGFYEHRGLVDLERTDGDANEEKEPDVRMAWPGARPLAFLRGLIDEVDEQLGDLLARRAALTRAVQDHKPGTARDPARERAIAEALARRAPALGVERLARIVDAVITESLDAARHR
ncbi:MAG: putative acetyltransferase [Nocardioides sp.]|jgi:chorismate mutase/GNAT superfamily N-acetyltransferase|nr:putative acetyltransferase [Nocardioides sp.]